MRKARSSYRKDDARSVSIAMGPEPWARMRAASATPAGVGNKVGIPPSGSLRAGLINTNVVYVGSKPAYLTSLLAKYFAQRGYLQFNLAGQLGDAFWRQASNIRQYSGKSLYVFGEIDARGGP